MVALRCVDDLALRQAIEKQLKMVELTNRFAPSVAVENPRELTQAKSGKEQEIAEACNRLIKNSIVCWSQLCLARRPEKASDEEARERPRRIIAPCRTFGIFVAMNPIRTVRRPRRPPERPICTLPGGTTDHCPDLPCPHEILLGWSIWGVAKRPSPAGAVSSCIAAHASVPSWCGRVH